MTEAAARTLYNAGGRGLVRTSKLSTLMWMTEPDVAIQIGAMVTGFVRKQNQSTVPLGDVPEARNHRAIHLTDVKA